jgi:hypothetical protein
LASAVKIQDNRPALLLTNRSFSAGQPAQQVGGVNITRAALFSSLLPDCWNVRKALKHSLLRLLA